MSGCEALTNFPRLIWYLANGQRRLRWNKQRLQSYQEKRLRSVVRYAYDFVPFYREKFRKAGITPSDVRYLEDLSKLPIIEKGEMKRESPQRLVSSEFSLAMLKVVRTSGSDGEPFQVFLNPAEDDWRKAIYMRANISCGQKPRDNWVVLTSPYHFTDTTNLQRRFGIFAQTCISVFSNASEQLRLVGEAQADVLDGYSGSIFLLAREAQKEGLNSIRPRMIFGTAELIDRDSTRLIERVFGAPYYDQFGCAELDRTGWQCPSRTGYHMDVDSVITQFVDEDGEDVSVGERGDVIYTSLFNYSMPLIRYAVGDVGIPSNETCPCGRQLPLMKVVEGRKTSFLVLDEGKFLSPNTLKTVMDMFELYDKIDKFRIIQKQVDSFKITVELRDKQANQKDFSQKLVRHIVRMLDRLFPGSRFDEGYFEVEFVDKILVDSSGKHKSIFSEVLAY